MSETEYPITFYALSADDGGGFAAVVPDLPGCVSDGETQAEAELNVRGAIAEWIATAVQTGRAVPEPTHVLQTTAVLGESVGDDAAPTLQRSA